MLMPLARHQSVLTFLGRFIRFQAQMLNLKSFSIHAAMISSLAQMSNLKRQQKNI